jgi:hypothetical protein
LVPDVVPEVRHEVVPEVRHEVVPEVRHEVVPKALHRREAGRRRRPRGRDVNL